MTDEATETPETPPVTVITAEVSVESGAVFVLTKSNAIFRNGQQLVIPHIGVPFLQELMEALTSEPFVTGIIENYLEQSEVVDEGPVVEGPTENALCGSVHVNTGARCERAHGHEGSHSAFQGAPADWGGGDDIVWEDVTIKPLETDPSRDVPAETYLDGFTVERFNKRDGGTVWHPRMNKRNTFPSREAAENIWNDPFADWYDRLCANIYIDWYDTYFPGNEDWRRWVAGDALVSDQGTRALVVPGNDGLVLINNEGNIFALVPENADIFSHWTVSR